MGYNYVNPLYRFISNSPMGFQQAFPLYWVSSLKIMTLPWGAIKLTASGITITLYSNTRQRHQKSLQSGSNMGVLKCLALIFVLSLAVERAVARPGTAFQPHLTICFQSHLTICFQSFLTICSVIRMQRVLYSWTTVHVGFF